MPCSIHAHTQDRPSFAAFYELVLNNYVTLLYYQDPKPITDLEVDASSPPGHEYDPLFTSSVFSPFKVIFCVFPSLSPLH